MKNNMIFHIPHNSTFIPPEIRNQFVLSDNKLAEELLLMTDHLTSDLFKPAITNLDVAIVFPVSRLVVDPERFLDNDKETMNKVGMGVIYKKTSSGINLRRSISNKEREDLINKYYEPHHYELNYQTEEQLKKYTRQVQIIDCHSFSSVPLRYEFNQEEKRPDICIGINSPEKEYLLLKQIVNFIDDEGYSYDINFPFSGSILPNKFFDDSRVKSIMIEVNRKLYMNEISGKRLPTFKRTSELIKGIVKKIRNLK